jgi:hypothetical protein
MGCQPPPSIHLDRKRLQEGLQTLLNLSLGPMARRLGVGTVPVGSQLSGPPIRTPYQARNLRRFPPRFVSTFVSR